MTDIHVHELKGLKPGALATYLSALGVMRLLSTQEGGDPSIRGFWRNDHFVLISRIRWDEIEEFFVQKYVPTPILAPWNIESGFFSLKPTERSSVESSEPDVTPEMSESPDDAESQEAAGDDEESGAMEQAVSDPLLDRFAVSATSRLALFRRAVNIAQEAIPDVVRDAENKVSRAHEEEVCCAGEELQMGATAERTQYEETNRAHLKLKAAAAKFKNEISALKTAMKSAPRGTPRSEELKQVERSYRAAKEEEKVAKEKAGELKKRLEQTVKRLKADNGIRKRIKAAKEATKKAKKDFGQTLKAVKPELIAKLRAQQDPQSREWIDAALALDPEGKVGFTSLFGSGGNDGRMEFTKNLRYHLNTLMDIDTGAARKDSAGRFRAAMFGLPTNLLEAKAVGQFFPGRAGGTNMAVGFFGNPGVNPWEFVLMLEGAVALVAGLSRRGDVEQARVSSPFWVEGTAAGFGSASQREESPRGEQWLPLWSCPLSYPELVELIRESRAQIGRKQSTRGSDLARAAARLGLARGVDELQRFAYLKRNGQANLAVSAGRVRVAFRSRQELLDDVAPWIERLVSHARDKNAPSSLSLAARRVNEALFEVCRQDAPVRLWREFLIALGDAELVLLRAGKSPVRRPLPRLRSGWLNAIDDGTGEGRTVLRLAVALASQHRPRKQAGGSFTDSVRCHFLPLDEAYRFKLDPKGRVQPDAEHVCYGRDLATDAVALVERRSIWARSADYRDHETHGLPLEAVNGCEATLEEVGAWVRGEVSDETVLALVRPLLALDWTEVLQMGTPIPAMPAGLPEPLQLVFRLAHLPFNVPVRDPDDRLVSEVNVRLDPEPLRRLGAGDFDGALKIVIRRLEASGLRPVFRRGVATAAFARRVAASLAFPISRDDAGRAARLVCKPYEVRDDVELLSTHNRG